MKTEKEHKLPFEVDDSIMNTNKDGKSSTSTPKTQDSRIEMWKLLSQPNSTLTLGNGKNK